MALLRRDAMVCDNDAIDECIIENNRYNGVSSSRWDNLVLRSDNNGFGYGPLIIWSKVFDGSAEQIVGSDSCRDKCWKNSANTLR